MSKELSTINNNGAALKTPETLAAEIRALTGSVLSGIMEIGRRFVDAKELLPHGEFGEWVRTQTGYSMSTANNFMRLYNEYGQAQGSLFGTEANSQTIGNLSYSKALALLEVPAEEREKFAQEVGAEDISVRELREAIREREEKLTEAQNTVEGYRQKLAYSEQTVAKKSDELARSEKELEELREQLEELQNAPKDVAVETVVDQDAVNKAAQEAKEAAEKELRSKIAKAERERNKAIQEQEKALRAQKDAEKKLAAEKLSRDNAETAAKNALEISNAQLQELQKKLALASSPEKVSFKFWFDQGQACVNSMLDCVRKLRESGSAEDAGKLTRALKMFLETALEEIEHNEADA